MREKVNKKKSEIGIFVKLLIMVVIVAFVYISIISPEKYQIYEKEYYNGTSLVPMSTEPDFTVSISPEKLKSSNAILIRLTDILLL